MLLMVAFSGCTTARKATNYFDKHQDTAAGYCAVKFPIKTSTKTVTKYMPGKTILVPGETVYMDYNCDSAVKAQMDLFVANGQKGTNQKGTNPKYIKIPVPVYERVDTNSIVETIIKESSSKLFIANHKIAVITHDLSAQTAETNKYKDSTSNWRGRALWTWGVLLVLLIGLVALKYFKFW